MRDIEGGKPPNVLFIEAQKYPARGQIIVHDVKDFPIDSLFQSGQRDRFSAIVDVSEGNRVGSPQVKKNTEGANSDTAADAQIAGTINISRSDNHPGHTVFLAIFSDDFVLLDFREAISVAKNMRLILNGA